MRINLDKDSYYPFYHVGSWGQVKCDVPYEVWERWDRVMTEFDEVQDEMEAFYIGER